LAETHHALLSILLGASTLFACVEQVDLRSDGNVTFDAMGSPDVVLRDAQPLDAEVLPDALVMDDATVAEDAMMGTDAITDHDAAPLDAMGMDATDHPLDAAAPDAATFTCAANGFVCEVMADGGGCPAPRTPEPFTCEASRICCSQ
jgi:hypothetical protein